MRALLLLLVLSSSLFAQDLTLTVEASLNGFSSDIHRFGFKDFALSGLDQYDLPEPPLPPSDFIAICFAVPDPDVPFPNRWREDYRNVEDFKDMIEVWEMHVTTDQTAGDIEFYFTLEEGPSDHLFLKFKTETSIKSVPLPSSVILPLDELSSPILLEMWSDEMIANDKSSWGMMKYLFNY
jgi:hypothetical protein